MSKLKTIFLFCILGLVGMTLDSNAQSLDDYPWVNPMIDQENCCFNEQVQLYSFLGVFDFIYISNDVECAGEGGTLYYSDGTLWCTSTPSFDCLDYYLLSFEGDLFACNQSSDLDLLSSYPWLSTSINEEDCCANNTVTLYESDLGHEYILVSPDPNCSTANEKFYAGTGELYCESGPNNDCVTLYGFSDMDIVSVWNCGEGGGEDNTGLPEGADITLRNTLQDSGEPEVTYPSLFGQPDDAYDEFASLSNTEIEFATALAQAGTPAGDISGLYEIDLTESSIEFTVLPDETDPFWVNVFGLFPEGKVDRYYFTFSEPHNITHFSSDNPNLNLRIDSETVIVVELMEGYDLQPGVSFTVDLNPPPSIVVEVTLFDLNEGVDPAVFQARDAEIEADFASLQPGFLKRMSGVDANGQYVVMVLWETLADADASIAAFGMDPTVGDYFAMIDGSTFSAERYTTFGIPDFNFNLIENNVIEITTFNINDDVDPEEFIARDAEIEDEFASLQPGFIRRTSGVNENDKYVVIVFWDALADADASIAAFGMDPTVADYFAMIDGATFAADRYTIFGNDPFSEGIDITLRNTLQDPGQAEVTYPSLFGQADDAYDEFASLSNTEIEFATALAQAGTPAGDISGLYEIDLTESTIEFKVLPDESDPFWVNVFGLFPAEKVDRYYFTFSEPHNITSASSNHASVDVRIDSDTVIVVEISEGYDLQPGGGFFISFNGAEELTNEQKARAFNEGLINGDASVIKWIHNDYIQHNLDVPTGKAPIAGFYGGEPTGITVDIHRSFEVGDYVFAQTTLGGTWGQFFGSNTDNILYEVWRFEDGFAVEHWDNIVAVVDDMDGTTQTDGEVTPAINLELTDANRALLEEMSQTLFVDGDWTNVSTYFDLENYVQHSVGAGTDGSFLASLEGQTGVSFYDEVKFIHVFGNFGLVMSQGGDITGQDPEGDYAYYDLFRMEDGKIVEHWDAIQFIKPESEWAHDNGKW